jgi:two-component system, NarL family, nitrate/nitrite response regulator NarL
MAAPSSTRSRPRLLVVDDHILFAEGLSRLLGPESPFQLAGHCTTPDQALDMIAAQPIDLVLLDVDLGSSRGTQFLARLSAAPRRRVKTLVLTAGVTESEMTTLFQLGAAGICFKDQGLDTLTRAIHTVLAGEAWIDQRSLSALARSRQPDAATLPVAFTERERQVLRGVFDGLANKEIGGRLRISETSVKAALQQLFQKTGVRTRSQLVRIVLEQHRGLV